MILYVNGDSHAAAAEAINCHAFAEDDSRYFYMGRAPHPDNLSISWGKLLADTVKASFHCDAESASSNQRIIRTTRSWIDAHKSELYRTLIVIQWSTWEREEWLIDQTYYQINASGVDAVPDSYQQRYKEFVAGVDWRQKTQQAHMDIWNFHQELDKLGAAHIFFNGNNDFSQIPQDRRHDWGQSYIGPYDPTLTYSSILRQNGFETVGPDSWHFGKEAHSFWKQFMLKYCIQNQLIL